MPRKTSQNRLEKIKQHRTITPSPFGTLWLTRSNQSPPPLFAPVQNHLKVLWNAWQHEPYSSTNLVHQSSHYQNSTLTRNVKKITKNHGNEAVFFVSWKGCCVHHTGAGIQIQWYSTDPGNWLSSRQWPNKQRFIKKTLKKSFYFCSDNFRRKWQNICAQ